LQLLQQQQQVGGARAGAPPPGTDILSLLKGGSAAGSAAAASAGMGGAPPGLGGSGGGVTPRPPGLVGDGGGDGSSSSSASSNPSSSPSSAASGAVGGGIGQEAYGMLGLLSLIRAPERDIQSLSLGADLTQIGLNLASPEPLHATFPTPWAREPATAPALEPHVALPSCYRLPQPALKTGHLSKFDVTTLLYIFYAMPRDVLQAYAAQELSGREWRYHKDLRLWFLRTAGPPLTAPPGTPSHQAALSAGTWVYFDVNAWERRPFTGSAPTLIAGFLSDEECRVKPPAAAGAAAAAPGGGVGVGAVGGPPGVAGPPGMQ
jgi:CCR4-NOT transcription complex subunit 2